MRNYIKFVVLLVGFGLLAAGLVLGVRANGSRPSASGRLQVAASFYPMGEFAQQVGGSRVRVSTLVRPGVEPHDYEPSPQDVRAIYTASVFVYNGAGLEPWADKLRPDLTRSHIVLVRASDGITLKAADASEEANSPADPHVWMDPVLAMKEVANVRDGLVQADPAHKQAYEANAQAYIHKLQALDAAFRAGLGSCRTRTIITSHQAFAYLGAEYGLRAVGIAGLSPDNEPSPTKLAQVAALAKANGVDYIFFESLASPKLSQTIASEVGARTIAFNPLEGLTNAETKQGKDYLSVQADNLHQLQTALHCE